MPRASAIIILRVSPIHGDARYDGVLAVHHVSAAARLAHSVLAAEEADTDPLADRPARHPGADRVDAAHDFVPRNARKAQARVGPGDRRRIAVADPAGFHPDPDPARSRSRTGRSTARSTPGAETSTA